MADSYDLITTSILPNTIVQTAQHYIRKARRNCFEENMMSLIDLFRIISATVTTVNVDQLATQPMEIVTNNHDDERMQALALN